MQSNLRERTSRRELKHDLWEGCLRLGEERKPGLVGHPRGRAAAAGARGVHGGTCKSHAASRASSQLPEQTYDSPPAEDRWGQRRPALSMPAGRPERPGPGPSHSLCHSSCHLSHPLPCPVPSAHLQSRCVWVRALTLPLPHPGPSQKLGSGFCQLHPSCPGHPGGPHLETPQNRVLTTCKSAGRAGSHCGVREHRGNGETKKTTKAGQDALVRGQGDHAQTQTRGHRGHAKVTLSDRYTQELLIQRPHSSALSALPPTPMTLPKIPKSQNQDLNPGCADAGPGALPCPRCGQSYPRPPRGEPWLLLSPAAPRGQGCVPAAPSLRRWLVNHSSLPFFPWFPQRHMSIPDIRNLKKMGPAQTHRIAVTRR